MLLGYFLISVTASMNSVPHTMSSSSAEDPFILRRRLLVLVLFFVAFAITTLLVPSNNYSDDFVTTAAKVLGAIVSLSLFVGSVMWLCGTVLAGSYSGYIYNDELNTMALSSGREVPYDRLSRHQKDRLDKNRLVELRSILSEHSQTLNDSVRKFEDNEGTAESEELLVNKQNIPLTHNGEGVTHDVEDVGNNYLATRRVPNASCAICLEEYEASDVICFSANPKCPHDFHEPCITKWFVSIGRSRSFCPKNMINYQLECPCCRQEFVSVPE
jgi:hypothetical protein